ncbi:hypothetical protein ABFS82_04G183800 [Erythranthe guttata]
MTRVQILLYLLLVCLSLRHHCAISSAFQETKSVSFKTSTAAYNSRNNNQIIPRNTREANEKKVVRKRPSEPSPVGNSSPPTRA